MLRAFLPHRYRNLRWLDKDGPLPFGRINLLVGPNNSGKSNWIKAMGFLPEMLLCEGSPTGFLQTAEAHGRAEVVNRADRARGSKSGSETRLGVSLQWLLAMPPQPQPRYTRPSSKPEPRDLLYSLAYSVGDSDSFPSGFHVSYEVLQQFPHQDVIDRRWPNGKSRVLAHREGDNAEHCSFPLHSKDGSSEKEDAVRVAVSVNETVLRQSKELLKEKRFYDLVYPEFSQTTEELLTFARGFRTYSSTDLDVRQMAEGAKIDLSVRALDAEGSEFVNVLRYLDQKYDFLDEYAERLRELMPELKRLKVIDASDTYKQLELHIGGHKYKPREMSDGTLKALWLALLLFSPERGSVLSIDEPEMNFHPAWLKVIGRWLQRFTSAEQLFVSTHSPDLLDTFTEGFKSGEVELFVFGLGDKEMRRVEPAALESFFKDGWELGDLYRVGEPQLGGWPW